MLNEFVQVAMIVKLEAPVIPGAIAVVAEVSPVAERVKLPVPVAEKLASV